MIKVLVVDDSGFFRRRIGEMLGADPEIEVIGYASNGEESISMAKKLKPNVITMDIEMPGMNGIEATKRIMLEQPTPIIMFSSLTTEGAQATLDALEAGALDFLPKRFQDIAKDIDEARILLCDRVRAVARTRFSPAPMPPVAKPAVKPEKAPEPAPVVATPREHKPTRRDSAHSFGILAIGTSTGGPVALQTVLAGLPADFPLPIVIVQHMPATFTPTFAQRLDQQCNISVKEAQDGDQLRPGLALLAPGGKQMMIKGKPGEAFVKIEESEPSLTYKPSVDITFRTLSRVYPNNTLAIILTGMGADGREGCRELKNLGSEIWAQDEASCVVYGMPAAVVDAGLANQVLDINSFAQRI
ncbi:MAG: chemotaxis response regulator protein-glutamate methylesterase, partial [Gammaproteobacteria bacterium]|nr:chemotaxis response regulator protein-glutamate methylesterase [Gammaproteobacteria bacterium]